MGWWWGAHQSMLSSRAHVLRRPASALPPSAGIFGSEPSLTQAEVDEYLPSLCARGWLVVRRLQTIALVNDVLVSRPAFHPVLDKKFKFGIGRERIYLHRFLDKVVQVAAQEHHTPGITVTLPGSKAPSVRLRTHSQNTLDDIMGIDPHNVRPGLCLRDVRLATQLERLRSTPLDKLLSSATVARLLPSVKKFKNWGTSFPIWEPSPPSVVSPLPPDPIPSTESEVCAQQHFDQILLPLYTRHWRLSSRKTSTPSSRYTTVLDGFYRFHSLKACVLFVHAITQAFAAPNVMLSAVIDAQTVHIHTHFSDRGTPVPRVADLLLPLRIERLYEHSFVLKARISDVLPYSTRDLAAYQARTPEELCKFSEESKRPSGLDM
ncbi:hypothetical protein MKEN_00243900 [Mycena kentingensis (nom. inval.)]|nr:hypothetical protein MKEN_00243900 [Mycena kentingensis (nom. inval.)]